MRETRRPRNRTTVQGLASSRPTLHARIVETAEQKRKRLGVLLNARRKALGITSAKKLSELTENAVGTRTIEAIEAGERVVSTSKYNVLEIRLGLPIGIMEAVLRGDVKEFPAPGEVDRPQLEAEEETYTKPEIRGIYRALGQKGFEEWVLSPTPREGSVRTTG